MPKESNIVHRYFKKKFENATILVKVNPVQLSGVELRIIPNDKIERREIVFDESIWDDLKLDGFEEASALEFNLYYAGLA